MILVFLAFLLVSFIGGAVNGILIRFIALEIPPLTGSFIRFMGAAVVLLPFWLQKREFIKKKDLLKVLPFSINAALFAIAIQYTSIIMANILYALVPVLVAFLGYLLLREKLAKQHIVGFLISLAGTAILIKGSLETSDIFTFGQPLGNFLIITGIFSWGFWIVAARSLSKSYSSLTILFFVFLTTAVLLLATLPFEWSIRPFILSNITAAGFASLLGVIFLSSVALYFLYQWLIKNTSAFLASLVAYGSIAFGVLAGPVILHERLTTQLIIGVVLVICGVFFATTYTQLKKQK